MESERVLLEKALARLEAAMEVLPSLPQDEDALVVAMSASKKAKKEGMNAEKEWGIGREGIVVAQGGGSSAAPKKRTISISELRLSAPVDEEYYNGRLSSVVRCQALVRRWLAGRAKRKMAKLRVKRLNLMQELLETEVTYVQKLGGVTQVILEPLEWNAKVSPDPLLPTPMIREIFSNIKDIYELNKTLLHDLEERIRKNWSPHQKVGDVFLQLSPHLPLYSHYYNQHDKAIQSLDRALTKYPTFVDFLERCKDHPDFVNLKLDTLLIEPVQRIPRYILYMQDIVKITPPEHPDHDNLVAAVAAISGVADNIDEKMNEIEQTKKILELQRKIVGGDFETLVAPKRRFLRKGPLLKCKLDKNIFTKDVDQVHLFLFSDLLLVTAKTVGQYTCKATVPLQSNLVRVKNVSDMTLVQNVFYLITPTRTFTFMGADPDEKEGWMADLNRCIRGGANAQGTATNDAQLQTRMDVTILGSEVRVDPKTKKSFTVYQLLVQNEATGAETDVWRRYSEFDKLKKGIRKAFPAIDFANLPRKHIVGNLNNDVIEARRIMLERYLQEIIMNPVVLESELVRSFLEADKVLKK